MKVRDRRYKEKDYKGHYIEAGAGGADCPCLPCFNVHNWYYKLDGRCIDYFVCATKGNKGCPRELEKPNHIIKISGKQASYFTQRLIAKEKDRKPLKMPKIIRKCLRCGQKVNISEVNFINISCKKESD